MGQIWVRLLYRYDAADISGENRHFSLAGRALDGSDGLGGTRQRFQFKAVPFRTYYRLADKLAFLRHLIQLQWQEGTS